MAEASTVFEKGIEDVSDGRVSLPENEVIASSSRIAGTAEPRREEGSLAGVEALLISFSTSELAPPFGAVGEVGESATVPLKRSRDIELSLVRARSIAGLLEVDQARWLDEDDGRGGCSALRSTEEESLADPPPRRRRSSRVGAAPAPVSDIPES